MKKRGADLRAWGLAVLVLVVTGWGAVLLPDQRLVSWVTDDTFYYLEVARNVARGAGFTFDGVHRTNGFHPLWQIALVPLCRLVSADFPLVRALMILQSALLAAATVLFWRGLRGPLNSDVAAATALALIGLPNSRAFWMGMESALFLLLLVLVWRAWRRIETTPEPRPLQGLGLGALSALLFLTRLEGAFATVAALLLLLARPLRPRRKAALGWAIAAPPALAAVLYLAWNRALFGVWLPVSGMVKAHWFRVLDPWRRFVGLLDVPWIGRDLVARLYGAPIPPDSLRLLCSAVFLTLVAAGLAWRSRVLPLLRETGTTYLALGCAGIMLADQILIGPFLAEWAMVPVHVLTALAIGLALARLPRAGRAALIVAVVLCLLRLPLQARRSAEYDATFMGRSLLLAQWIDTHVPRGERLGSLYSGVLGYFGHRTVVSLDGLVNDVDFYREVVIGGDLDRYLERTRIGWLADIGCHDQRPVPTLTVVSRGRFRTAHCYTLAHSVGDAAVEQGCALTLWKKIEPDCR